MKIEVLQRVLAGYRIPFFDELAARFGGSLTLFAGHARREEMIDESRLPEIAKVYPAKNLHVLPGVLNKRALLSGERRVGKECRSRWSPYH